MPLPGILSAAASALPIPGASIVANAAGSLSGAVNKVISVVDPGKARDAARIQRRDFFLNAAKAGSVLAARYLINGENNVYTVKEKGQYRDGVNELANGAQHGHPDWPETLQLANAQGPLWDDDVGNGDLLPVGQRIAQELGQHLNVPAGASEVNETGAIESWAHDFGYTIRNDTSQALGQLAAGVGSAVTSAVAPNGSANKSAVLLPTNKTTIALVIIVVLVLGYLAMRKH